MTGWETTKEIWQYQKHAWKPYWKRQVIVKLGKELNRDGKWNCMAINQTPLALAMDELHEANRPITNQVRIIEHSWDGMGEWKAA